MRASENEETLTGRDPARHAAPLGGAEDPMPAGSRQPTLHPVVYGISVVGLAWIVLVSALTYAQGGTMGLNMVVVVGLLVLFVGLPLAAAGLIKARNTLDPNRPGPDEGHTRPSFAAWRKAEMPVWGGGLRGSAAAFQVALLPVLLAIGFTVMAVIAAWARSGVMGG